MVFLNKSEPGTCFLATWLLDPFSIGTRQTSWCVCSAQGPIYTDKFTVPEVALKRHTALVVLEQDSVTR